DEARAVQALRRPTPPAAAQSQIWRDALCLSVRRQELLTDRITTVPFVLKRPARDAKRQAIPGSTKFEQNFALLLQPTVREIRRANPSDTLTVRLPPEVQFPVKVSMPAAAPYADVHPFLCLGHL